MSAQRDLEPDLLHGNLRQLVVRLDLAQLLVVLGWIQQQLRLLATRPSLRGPVCVPDQDERLDFTGDTVELIGQVRRTIHSLPRYHLLVLNKWVRAELDERLPKL